MLIFIIQFVITFSVVCFDNLCKKLQQYNTNKTTKQYQIGEKKLKSKFISLSLFP